jgi:surfactin synthase thioesterase subunit
VSGYENIWLSSPVTINNKHNYRLICFPHAGGTSSFFRSWGSNLVDSEILSVRYPGRSERIDEPQPTDIYQISIAIANAIQPLKNLPLVLFGHSMGAVIALETARALEEKGIFITHLFASGSRNGPSPQKQKYIEEDNKSLCKHLVEMGGTAADAVNDPIFCEIVLPSIRADGKMFHEYNMDLEPRLNCPVTTIYGNVDDHADIRPWGDLAPGKFYEECVPGDHFYLI